MPLEKKIFSRFYMLSRLVTIRQMRAQSKFRQMWGNFSHLPKIGDQAKNPITRYMKITPYPPTVRSIPTSRPFAGCEN